MTLQPVFPNFSILYLPSVNSTNTYAENLLDTEIIADGSIIYTANQSNGIGQGTNLWESEAGKNLTATIILHPTFLEARNQFFISIIVSLAVRDVVNAFLENKSALIKWPNDIYIDHRKIAGILIKNYISGDIISDTIAGIGLNINQTEFKHAPLAISLKILANRDFEITDILTEWHKRLSHYYVMLKSDKETLLNKYLFNMYLIDTYAEYTIHDKKINASITGITEFGQLKLKDVEGQKYICGLKDIVFPLFR